MRLVGAVPNSRERIRTLIPAMWLRGRRRDHVFPNSAPINLLEALAEVRRADAERAISFGVPELPVVVTTSAVRAETDSVEIGLNARAGPSETRAFAIRAINSLRLHAESTVRTSRCAFCSIARVGYRPYSTMEES
jgi:hypothetical protein